MDGLSNKVHCEHLAKKTKAVLYLAAHFIAGSATHTLMVVTRQSASVLRGEWVYKNIAKHLQTRLGSKFTVRILA